MAETGGGDQGAAGIICYRALTDSLILGAKPPCSSSSASLCRSLIPNWTTGIGNLSFSSWYLETLVLLKPKVLRFPDKLFRKARQASTLRADPIIPPETVSTWGVR